MGQTKEDRVNGSWLRLTLVESIAVCLLVYYRLFFQILWMEDVVDYIAFLFLLLLSGTDPPASPCVSHGGQVARIAPQYHLSGLPL